MQFSIHSSANDMITWRRLLTTCIAVLSAAILSAQQPDSTFWVPNGPVNALLLHDTTVILGGDFDQLSPVTGSLVRLDSVTAIHDPAFFKVNGPVYATTQDADGNIYVGGRFTRVGGQIVENIFRLKPDGSFDNSFVHTVSGTVYALHVHDSDIFIGGSFTKIDGEVRSNFGGINLYTGLVNTCDPVVNGPVYCMDYDPTGPVPMMVIGGQFNDVFGFNPPNLAKIQLSTGYPHTFNAVPWTAVPNLNGPVYAMKIIGPLLYIAGEFTLFGPIPRRGLAALFLQNGNLQPSNANVIGEVYAMEFTASGIYIGGDFAQLGNTPRSNLAKVDYNFAVQPWNPGTDGEVRVIKEMDSTRFFVGGDFDHAGGDTCRRGAIIDTAGVAADWNPVINATVRMFMRDSSGRMYAGGDFFGVGGMLRNNLCALSVNTGKVTAWNPDVNGTVYTMTMDGDSLYFAGTFNAVDGMTRGRMAAIHLTTNTLLPFNPVVNGIVRTIVVTDSLVYAGGNFTSLGGQTRGNIGKVNKSTGLATPWNPNCLGSVNSILVTPHWIYVAGFYNTISGVTRQNLSRIHPESAVADMSWICDTDDGIYHAEFYNSTIAVTGWFNTVNGQLSPDFAIVDTTSLQILPVNFSCDGFARTFTRLGDDFFISGMFDVINAAYHPRLAAYDQGDGSVDPWAPFPDAEPFTMQATSTRLFIGGTMGMTAGRFQPYFQVLPIQWVTGMDEAATMEHTLHVFPNPATDNITVNDVNAFDEYALTDIAGQVVLTGTVNGSILEISLAELAPGMYVLTMAGAATAPVTQTVIRQQ
jgi:hypothetical protein